MNYTRGELTGMAVSIHDTEGAEQFATLMDLIDELELYIAYESSPKLAAMQADAKAAIDWLKRTQERPGTIWMGLITAISLLNKLLQAASDPKEMEDEDNDDGIPF